MKKVKKQKNSRKPVSSKKVTKSKKAVKTKKVSKKPVKKTPKKSKLIKVKKVKVVLSKKAHDENVRLNRLISRGKEKGFVTYDEILKEFPTVEENIIFLDELYEKLHTAGIDVLEGGGLLEMPVEETGKKY